MIELMSGYPDNVLAFSGTGEVTADDYRNVLIPETEARMARHDRVDIIYYLGTEFKGMTTAAAWEDLRLGLSRWSAFGRIAIVTDTEWIKDAMRLFAPLYHHPVRVFAAKDLEAARKWILEPDKSS